MSAGYGRGHYGNEQLAQRRSGGVGGGWFKIAAVVGLGAVIWWWVIPAIGPKSKHVEETPPQPQEPPPDLSQAAQARGFSSTAAYEDSVLMNARELKAAGAKVELGPHLAHLEPRLRCATP